MGDPSDNALLARARAGDQRAFSSLYQRHLAAVLRRAIDVLGDDADPDEVQELVQDVFTTAWRRRATIVLVGPTLLPWLSSTVWHLSQNRRRRHRSIEPAGIPEEDPAPADDASVIEEIVDRRMLLAWVEREVSTLGALDRSIFTLCLVSGYPCSAAAEALGVSEASVRNRLSRLKSRLRHVRPTESVSPVRQSFRRVGMERPNGSGTGHPALVPPERRGGES